MANSLLKLKLNHIGSASNIRIPIPTANSLVSGLTTDRSGNIYISDTEQHVVYRVKSNGDVKVIAGTLGVKGYENGIHAKLHSPRGLSVDASGNLYVADTGNGKIRVVDIGSNVSTLSSGFKNITDVSVSPNGDIIAVDKELHSIYRIEPGGRKFLVAGGIQGDVYGIVSGVKIKGSAARFDNPEGVAVNCDGRIYVADTGNSKIKVIETDGFVNLFSGTTTGDSDGSYLTAKFTAPTDLAIALKGNRLFVLDRLVDRSKAKIVSMNGNVKTMAEVLTDDAIALTVDANEDIYCITADDSGLIDGEESSSGFYLELIEGESYTVPVLEGHLNVEFTGSDGGPSSFVEVNGVSFEVKNVNNQLVWDVQGVNHTFTTIGESLPCVANGFNFAVIFDGFGSLLFRIALTQPNTSSEGKTWFYTTSDAYSTTTAPRSESTSFYHFKSTSSQGESPDLSSLSTVGGNTSSDRWTWFNTTSGAYSTTSAPQSESTSYYHFNSTSSLETTSNWETNWTTLGSDSWANISWPSSIEWSSQSSEGETNESSKGKTDWMDSSRDNNSRDTTSPRGESTSFYHFKSTSSQGDTSDFITNWITSGSDSWANVSWPSSIEWSSLSSNGQTDASSLGETAWHDSSRDNNSMPTTKSSTSYYHFNSTSSSPVFSSLSTVGITSLSTVGLDTTSEGKTWFYTTSDAYSTTTAPRSESTSFYHFNSTSSQGLSTSGGTTGDQSESCIEDSTGGWTRMLLSSTSGGTTHDDSESSGGTTNNESESCDDMSSDDMTSAGETSNGNSSNGDTSNGNSSAGGDTSNGLSNAYTSVSNLSYSSGTDVSDGNTSGTDSVSDTSDGDTSGTNSGPDPSPSPSGSIRIFSKTKYAPVFLS